MTRARDLGIIVGRLPTGPRNAITDVAGVSVGHATLISGSGKRVRGEGPVRTGLTLVVPFDGAVWSDAVFAGVHILSGVTHPTGLEFLREGGRLSGPIAMTSSWSVGTVCDALVARGITERGPLGFGTPPVVLETWDGILNDVEGQHVHAEQVDEAFAAVSDGAGCRGQRRWRHRHDLPWIQGRHRHGIASDRHAHRRLHRRCARAGQPRSPGSAQHRRRSRRRPLSRVAHSHSIHRRTDVGGSGGLYPSRKLGSILVVVATDAPLLPTQCTRLASRAMLGVGRTGGAGENWSGDLCIAFSTANRGMSSDWIVEGEQATSSTVQMLADPVIDSLFYAAIEATEEAIVNALVAAETMTGGDDVTAYALPHDELMEVMRARNARA